MMAEPWPVKPLGEVAEIIAGQSPKGEFYNDSGDGLPFYQGKKEFQKKYIGSPTKWTSKTTKIAYEGDILMSVRAPVGPINFATQEICIGRGLAAIRVSEHMNRNFLFYQLLFKQDDISGKDGAVFPSINKGMIGEIRVVVPPLKEQQRIVSILDEAFKKINDSITSTGSSLDVSAEIFPSKLHEILSKGGSDWFDYTLLEVSLDFGRGKSKHRPRNYKPLYGGPYPFVQTGDVRSSNHFISEYTQTYSEMGLAQSKLWPKGTVCITIAANIAETAILEFDACFPDSVIGVVVNPEITTNEYVEYALQFLKGKLQKEGKGSAQDNINMGTFKELKFPFPPLDEQKEIVNLLNMLNEQTVLSMESHQSKIQHLEELKQSILQEAFNGTLLNPL
jgi:type I restriction enzyme S subunit